MNINRRLPRFYTTSEIASMLHIKETTVRVWASRGYLQGYKISKKQWVFRGSDVAKFMKQHKCVSSPKDTDDVATE